MADLRLARFAHVSLQGCDFSLADLRGAVFVDCDLRGAIFGRTRLADNRFDGSWLVGTRGLSVPQQRYVRTRGGRFLSLAPEPPPPPPAKPVGRTLGRERGPWQRRLGSLRSSPRPSPWPSPLRTWRGRSSSASSNSRGGLPCRSCRFGILFIACRKSIYGRTTRAVCCGGCGALRD